MIKKLILIFIFSLSCFAAEERYLNRSAHGYLMGDAYTAIADDAYSLFYNPALLGRHSGFSFWAINPQISLTNPLKDPDKYEDLGSTPTEMADVLFSSPIHVSLGAVPGLKIGHFGLSAIVSNNTNILLQNKITPMLDIDYRFDKGFIMGYGHPLFGSFSKDGGGESLSLGVGVKYLSRESIHGTFNLTSPTLFAALESSDPDTILEALGRVKGSGWGFDLGLDYATKSGPNGFSAGLALLDVYTGLQTDNNELDREVQPQPLQANFGAAWSFELAQDFGMVLSADLRNLEDTQMDLIKRSRLGLELKFSPVLSLLAGINSGLYSYGLKLNTGLLTVYTGFYDVDIGAQKGQIISNRAIIYMSLFDFKFDG